MGESDNNKITKILEILTVISIPVIGYVIAFVSELAYFNYFKIPSELIEISFTNLFNSILITLVTLLTFFYCSSFLFWGYKEHFKQKSVRIFLVYVQPPIFLALMALILFLYRHKNYQIILLILSFHIAFLPFYYRVINYFIKFGTFYSKFVFLTLFTCSYLFLLIYVYGDTLAKNQKDYYILKSSPEKIILRMYKDILIVAPFDRKNNLIDPTYTILKTPEIISPIKIEKIGKIKLIQ